MTEKVPKLETVAWASTAVCWWIRTRYRVTVSVHSCSFAYSWPSAWPFGCSLLSRGTRCGSIYYFLHYQVALKPYGPYLGPPPASRTIKNGSLVQRDGEFDMLTFSFSQLLPRMLPWHSLQFHSTSFNFLTVREARGQEVHPPPPLFISAQKSEQVWISYFRLVRTRLCRNNPSSPPGAETLAGSWYRPMVSAGSDMGF